MSSFIPFDRSQPYLLPPDLRAWLPSDDVAHFIVAAVDRVPLSAFSIPNRTGGKAQYHPRLMLAVLIHGYANGVFSSRRIERATYRDIGMRFVAANLHPDHDTIATFRRTNRAAIEAAFLQVLLLARETGLMRLGTVSIDGTKIDADASKFRSIRYDRMQELRAKLAGDIADLMECAETADATEIDPQALPAELARREALKAKLDEACARLEAQSRAETEAAREEYDRKKAAYDAKKGRRGRAPKPPADTPPPDRQTNLTDPDSRLMRRSDAHEFRQAYNAQAVVCAEGSQLILTTDVVATTADAPGFAEIVLAMEHGIGLPGCVLADTGYASGPAVARLEARGVEPLVAIGRPVARRSYDFRPERPDKKPRQITEPWRLAMKERLENPATKRRYALRKQTVEPVFGIIKAAMGFTRFHLRGLARVKTEWTLAALAYNCRRVARLTA
ncbi:IS1182 family transposase [Novacetimonas hansenii]|uniref:IS1182 family transposase n=1 Tax=Novacetimonas hansenii TaxID=436 RepID=UPI001784C989|nr:IS1182 family transposase [Novacetimonas hansenii]QOF95900.1 IS1182 family transposase [Novacetimonas hansenii]